MQPKITKTVRYLNMHLNDNDKIVRSWLNEYLHTAYCYQKQNFDGTYLRIQPGEPDETVATYMFYYDKSFDYGHKSGRLALIFDSGTQTEISMYKFKKYIRSIKSFLTDIDDKELY